MKHLMNALMLAVFFLPLTSQAEQKRKETGLAVIEIKKGTITSMACNEIDMSGLPGEILGTYAASGVIYVTDKGGMPSVIKISGVMRKAHFCRNLDQVAKDNFDVLVRTYKTKAEDNNWYESNEYELIAADKKFELNVLSSRKSLPQ